MRNARCWSGLPRLSAAGVSAHTPRGQAGPLPRALSGLAAPSPTRPHLAAGCSLAGPRGATSLARSAPRRRSLPASKMAAPGSGSPPPAATFACGGWGRAEPSAARDLGWGRARPRTTGSLVPSPLPRQPGRYPLPRSGHVGSLPLSLLRHLPSGAPSCPHRGGGGHIREAGHRPLYRPQLLQVPQQRLVVNTGRGWYKWVE